jgi:hypothetical protein
MDALISSPHLIVFEKLTVSELEMTIEAKTTRTPRHGRRTWVKTGRQAWLLGERRDLDPTQTTTGAPQAEQNADRWHVLKNLTSVFEDLSHRQARAILLANPGSSV